MKDISFRPTKLILSLFEQIRKLDHLPNTDRNSIVNRATMMALKNKNINWQLISAITVEEDGFDGSIPKHVVLKVDEENFNLVNGQIKDAFSMEKVTIPYTLKLLLVNYLTSLNQTSLDVAQVSLPSGIELAMFKSEYMQSLYRSKKRLLEACKVYLKVHIKLQQDLTQYSIRQHTQLNDIHDLSKYFPDKRTETGVPTMAYLAQILAGWFIFTTESQYESSFWDGILDHIVKSLEDELQIQNESTFEKLKTKKDAETADYYKNVYSRMMGR